MLEQIGRLNGPAENTPGWEADTPSPRPHHQRRSPRAARTRRPRWIECIDCMAEILVRLIAFLVATAFFFGLPILALYGYELPCANRYLLYVPFVFGAAFSSYYFGSCVTVASDARISPTTSLQITAAGSAACAVLAAWVGFQIFLPKSCEAPKAYVHHLWLSNQTVDQTQYDVLNKHWPLASDDQISVAFGYQIEIAREQKIPIRMKIPQSTSSYLCVLNVNIHTSDIPSQAHRGEEQSLTYKSDVYSSFYELTFNRDLVAPGSMAPRGERGDCFKAQDGQRVEGIDIHPNGARLIKMRNQAQPA